MFLLALSTEPQKSVLLYIKSIICICIYIYILIPTNISGIDTLDHCNFDQILLVAVIVVSLKFIGATDFMNIQNF